MATDTSMKSYGSLRGLCLQTSINLKKELLDAIDVARGTQNRSAYIVGVVSQHLSGGDADTKHLIQQLETDRFTQSRLEDEVAYLRAELSKMHDAVAVKLLSEPKRHWWQRRTK